MLECDYCGSDRQAMHRSLVKREATAEMRMQFSRDMIQDFRTHARLFQGGFD